MSLVSGVTTTYVHLTVLVNDIDIINSIFGKSKPKPLYTYIIATVTTSWESEEVYTMRPTTTQEEVAGIVILVKEHIDS